MIGYQVKKYISPARICNYYYSLVLTGESSAYKRGSSRFVTKASNILYGYRNVKLMYECCPKHLRMRTATMKQNDKET